MTRPPPWARPFAALSLAVLLLPVVGALSALLAALLGHPWWQWGTSP